MNNRVYVGAFLEPFLVKQLIDEADQTMKKKFFEKYRPKIEEMWQEFLMDYTKELVAEEHPLILLAIRDTPLSKRAKDCLRFRCIDSVYELSLFSPSAIKDFKGAGKKTQQEIVDYMKVVLGVEKENDR